VGVLISTSSLVPFSAPPMIALGLFTSAIRALILLPWQQLTSEKAMEDHGHEANIANIASSMCVAIEV